MKPKFKIVVQDGDEVKTICEITPEEFRIYESDVDLLRRFEASRQLYPLVKSDAAALEDYVAHVESSDPERYSDRLELLATVDEGNRRLLNLLTSCKMLVDHAETRFKRTYGEDSEPFRQLERAKHAAYDSEFAYRFSYRLRNYVQHCGMPAVGPTKESVNPTGKLNLLTFTRLALAFDPEQLLADFNYWKHVEKDLEARNGQRLGLAGFGTAVADVYETLDELIYLAEYDAVFETAIRIGSVLSDGWKTGLPSSVGTFLKRGRMLDVSLIPPPLDVMQVLGALRLSLRGSRPRFYPMRGYLFEAVWESEEKCILTCESLPELRATGSTPDEALDEAENEVRRIAKRCLDRGEKMPPTMPWREQYRRVIGVDGSIE
ncbi:MAG: hypothetical protein WD275_08760 [Rhodothermales bacterium]